MSLEGLTGLNVQVTSSSKKAESLRDATSAIYVITSDDIQRSGFTHLADLLRMVPGVQVAQQAANQWAISARGFDATYNDKMLVLVDGRSVYENETGGVDWDDLDLMLEDIDRIEVIRGPGGALWGVNAINGVVNIITKDSKVTQGLTVSGVGGNRFYGGGDARFGGKLDGDFYYRLYAKTGFHAPLQDPATGGDSQDGWNDQRAGFRADWHGEKDSASFQGDYQRGWFDFANFQFNPLTLQYPDGATNAYQEWDADLSTKWTHSFSADSEIQFLAYDDQWESRTLDGQDSLRNRASLQVQHRFQLTDWSEITWGGDINTYSDSYHLTDTLFNPLQETLWIYGLFLQDRFVLVKDRLFFTAGAKVEKAADSGYQLQPTGRLLWTPDSTNSFWAAVSRASRIPARFEMDATLYYMGFPAGPTTMYGAVIPNPDLQPEDMVAYEAGYRASLGSRLSLDLATFYNRYYQVVSSREGNLSLPSPVGGLITNELAYLNGDGGAIYGAELSTKWDLADAWKAALAYSYQSYDQAMVDSSNVYVGGPPPHNLLNLRLSWDADTALQFNGALYYTDATFLPNSNPSTPSTVTPDSARLDLGATWKPSSQWEFSLWGQNLQGAHSEALVAFGVNKPINVVPAVYGRVTARY